MSCMSPTRQGSVEEAPAEAGQEEAKASHNIKSEAQATQAQAGTHLMRAGLPSATPGYTSTGSICQIRRFPEKI